MCINSFKYCPSFDGVKVLYSWRFEAGWGICIPTMPDGIICNLRYSHYGLTKMCFYVIDKLL